MTIRVLVRGRQEARVGGDTMMKAGDRGTQFLEGGHSQGVQAVSKICKREGKRFSLGTSRRLFYASPGDPLQMLTSRTITQAMCAVLSQNFCGNLLRQQ